MDYKIVFLLALIVATTVCLPSDLQQSSYPCSCGRIYEPVCASDGITSNSLCEFKCRVNVMKHNGKEIKIMRAGRLTISLVMFYVVIITSQGVALISKPPSWSPLNCLCTRQYDPVCDTQFRRYNNICTIKCYNKFLAKYEFPQVDMVDCITYLPITKKYVSY